MNRKIQRYSIKDFGFNYTDLPSDAFFMDLRVKGEVIVVTFLIDTEAPKHRRAFYVAKSGEELSDEYEFEYLDATIFNGELAYLFEQKY